MKYTLFITTFFFVVSPFLISAQSYNPIQSGDIQQQATLTASPQYPTANQIVTLTLSAPGASLTSVPVSWTVDGTLIQNGVGMTTFSVNSGEYGKTRTVTVRAQPSSQPAITRTITIIPQEVSIIYEATSYVPPFYKGKALFNKEGTVRFIAMPNMTSSTGASLSPSTLIYKWIINDTVQGSVSGYGKNTYTYTSNILSSGVKVEVEVTSADGKTVGRGLIITSPESSEAFVYEKSPLYGILYNKELSTIPHTLKDREITIKAEPFYISIPSSGAGAQYIWSINNQNIPVPQAQNYVTLRNSTGQQGSSIIGLIINNPTHLLQKISKSLTINF